MATKFGLAGRLAAWGERSQITPLLALFGLLLGVMAAFITPREEEPQIDVTMADVMVAFPGARADQVEQQLATPLEQHFSRMQGIEHIYSVSQAGQALVTVQFEVGVARDKALLELFDSLASWQQGHPQTSQPLVKARGIDDVPILGLTLTSSDLDLKSVADTLRAPLQNVSGVRDIAIIGAEPEQLSVTLDTTALAQVGLDISQVAQALTRQNVSTQAGYRLAQGEQIAVQAGGFIASAQELRELIVAVVDGRPVRLEQVATVSSGANRPSRYVWSRTKGAQAEPAVTMTVTKKAGENAVDVAAAVLQRLADLEQQWLPPELEVAVTRNYGQTADDKASKLIQKLIFATISVVALVLFALGKREAVVVGSAVVLTLATTLFASWAWGFTLNRVSLFALIFSIGILVDDAIVVVENIHRHLALGKSLKEAIPPAVDEVGGPTILATFTVIAALLPMAFVSGLMGPYMSPIPINASLGMLLSLIIALTVTPWLARHILSDHSASKADSQPTPDAEPKAGRLQRLFSALMRPLLESRKRRYFMGAGLIVLIVAMLGLAAVQAVVMKMLPFDDKSEIKLVLDMPEGSSLEQTNGLLLQLAEKLDEVPEVTATQIYAGTASPIGFNGLVRQYYLRRQAHQGDIQVSLAAKGERDRASHEVALAIRPLLAPLVEAAGARLKVVEVPPGPPVMAPIVAEVYGPSAIAREQAAEQVQRELAATAGVVDVDTTLVAQRGPNEAAEEVWQINTARATQLGVQPEQALLTLQTALSGLPVTYVAALDQLQPVPVKLYLPANWQGQVRQLEALTVTSNSGASVPLSALLEPVPVPLQQPRYHKDLRPVVYVTADMAGELDSPLYGLFAAAGAIDLPQSYIAQPPEWDQAALKWDGEWQITYETFRDMGLAYAVGLLLIYLLVVAHFGSYGTPLVIMAPIPLTLIGIMPGHALLGAQFTATSMIGMIALAGIIVRNSILLVDFVRLSVAAGKPINDAVIEAAAVRTQPIVLTAIAAMMGAFFILDDPIFNGLAVSLIFGIAVSTVLTLLVIPLLYASLLKRQQAKVNAL